MVKRDHVQEDVYNRMRPGRRYNQAQATEAQLYDMYEKTLSELAMNRFKWTGFPPSVDIRYLEKRLHEYGLAVAFRDTGSKKRPGTDMVMVLGAVPSGTRNMMDNPTGYTLTGAGIEQHFQGVQLAMNKCVPIWSNYTRTTDWAVISTYARKLANVDMTIEINLKNARRTKVLVYDENTRLSVQNINDQIDAGNPTIAVKQDLGAMIQAVDLGIDPKSIETLSVVRGRLWSEAMGLLGINNANQDKKERLVESEVDANDDQIENMRLVSLNARQQACVKMREMFPDELGNVWVEYHTDGTEHENSVKVDSTDDREPTYA